MGHIESLISKANEKLLISPKDICHAILKGSGNWAVGRYSVSLATQFILRLSSRPSEAALNRALAAAAAEQQQQRSERIARGGRMDEGEEGTVERVESGELFDVRSFVRSLARTARGIWTRLAQQRRRDGEKGKGASIYDVRTEVGRGRGGVKNTANLWRNKFCKWRGERE